MLVRRLNIAACHVAEEGEGSPGEIMEQLNMFTDYAALEKKRMKEEADLKRERKLQEAMLDIKKKFGKNAILKGINLKEGATAKDRNRQIGGHKA